MRAYTLSCLARGERVTPFQPLESGDHQKIKPHIEAYEQSMRRRQKSISRCEHGLARLRKRACPCSKT